ncbi:hypothetical protein TWF481_002208 [Arthrobotrys musiformis]|uniref:UV excision repair protein RAD23 n=1 Tax=Arthrobotrys musiformis TaxID=47236 RepID=A0AAV9VUN5_9PEZI
MSDIVKLTFKDLKNDRFTIEAGTADTISTVKAKIQEEKGWEPSAVKLIYSGKILQDAQTVGSYNIDEKGFIVCMVSKAKAAPKASSSSSAAAPSTPVKAPTPVQTPSAPIANAASSSTVPAVVPETPTPAPQVAATSQPTTAAFNDPSSLAMGTARESAIQQMMEMGFPRPSVEAAMRAAFNNPDRAVEYLMTGIPEHLQREATPAQSSSRAPPTQPAAGPTAPAAATTEAQPAADADEPVNLFEAAAAQRQGSRGTPAGGRGGSAANPLAALAGGGGANLDFLRNNPQFQQLRQVIQEHPQMLEPILQQVGAANPQLAQLIATNPEGFLRLLSEGVDEEELAGAAGGGGLAIHVTEEERDAIERLCQLGFERDVVIQAYFACDKNEEMAANFLFENPQDPEP